MYAIENSFPKELASVHRSTLLTHLRPFILEDYLRKNDIYISEFADEIDRLINDTDENFHDRIEGGVAQECLRRLVSGSGDFWNEMPKKLAFVHFISLQFFRTKKMLDAVRETAPQFDDLEKSKELKLDMVRMWRVNRLMLALNVTHSLCRDPKYRLVVLENLSDVPFIAGDNVAVNTYAVDGVVGVPELFEFYYPVSPGYAALVTNKNYGGDRVKVSSAKAHEYNLMMMKFAQEMVFSNKKELLVEYSELFESCQAKC